MLLGIQLFLALAIIFLAAQLFSNALEYFGEKSGLSSGATGSIFAAVATALPETSIPVLAILAGTTNQSINEEISVGAILGAPLMLSTLSLCIMAISAINKRSIQGMLVPEKTGVVRDLNFFSSRFFYCFERHVCPVTAKNHSRRIRYSLGNVILPLSLFNIKNLQISRAKWAWCQTQRPALIFQNRIQKKLSYYYSTIIFGAHPAAIGSKRFYQ